MTCLVSVYCSCRVLVRSSAIRDMNQWGRQSHRQSHYTRIAITKLSILCVGAYVGAVEAVADEVPPAVSAGAEEAVDRWAVGHTQVVHAARRDRHRVVRPRRVRRRVRLGNRIDLWMHKRLITARTMYLKLKFWGEKNKMITVISKWLSSTHQSKKLQTGE